MNNRGNQSFFLLALCCRIARFCIYRIDQTRHLGEIQVRALRKLRQLDAAVTIEDLHNPPGNRPELLKGKRAGQMSIRINDQWRICFRWVVRDAEDVEIVDYH